MKRFVLHPGYIPSTTGGLGHFVGGPTLARIHGVDIRHCVYGDVPTYKEQDGDVHLYPFQPGERSEYALTPIKPG